MEIAKEEYREIYLKSPYWRSVQRKSKEVYKACLGCGNRKFDLHHRTYHRKGHEEMTDLVPLCRDCHVMVHDWLNDRGLKVRKTFVAMKAIFHWTEQEYLQKIAKFQRKKQKAPLPSRKRIKINKVKPKEFLKSVGSL